jgi:hypothetical protein
MAMTAAFVLGASSAPSDAAIPTDIASRVPTGYTIMTLASSNVDGRTFYLVALRARKELESGRYFADPDRAPLRPLVIYERGPRGVTQVGRNDHVIDRAGDAGLAGNGCDPFEDRRIAVKGRHFTVENGVSCGAHWTKYLTFRFDARLGYVFDSYRFQSWKLNQSDDPNAEALIPEAKRAFRGSKRRPVPFSLWRPR